MKKRSVHYIGAMVLAAVCVALDQFTKYLAIANLKGQEALVLIKDVFVLEYLENRGAAFGLFQGQSAFFYVSVAAISIAVIWFYLRVPMEPRFRALRACAVLVTAGALGNFIDRVRFHYVVDFFYFELIDFPIFNVADIYVTVAAFALILLLFFYYKEEDIERIIHRGR